MCIELMRCLKDVVPDYAEKVTSLVLNRSMTKLERVDTEVVLGTWGSRWTAGWRDLPEDPRLPDYDYDYIMAPQRGRPYGANLGSMGRNTGTWSIRSECLSNITSWSRRKGIENTTLPFIPE